ncbi:universal stress protein A-like protein [Vitis vinifera]|nr:universal stress protein A-like protein [Vitis vinifera]|eukprot:XP_002283402.1 PREDICTED: universal stress protein A-like protein [Vitis vinifera]
MEGVGEKSKSDDKKKMMVCIDESEYSHHALNWALENLRDSLSNFQLIVFTVQSLSDFTYIHASTLGVAPPDLITEVQERQKKVAFALLERAKEICAQCGIVAETITEVGDPKEAICKAVEKLNIQFLVLGSHGRGAFGRAFLGSVSNYCMHNAKCPVLVVRKPE